jgi:hypothetical protein
MIRPARSSSRNLSHVAQRPTRLLFAMSTRGALRCVRNTPTGLPLCTNSVSSSPRSRSSRTIASNASQLRAAFPVPPYTTRSSGRSATSGSRLFISMRIAASCCHPLHVISVPWGARTTLAPCVITLSPPLLPMKCIRRSGRWKSPSRSIRCRRSSLCRGRDVEPRCARCRGHDRRQSLA